MEANRNEVEAIYMTEDEFGNTYVEDELSSDMKQSWNNGLIDIFKIEVVDGKITMKKLCGEEGEWRDVKCLSKAMK